MQNTRVRVDSEAAASIHENGVVILHIGKGRVYAGNETGARIWRGIVQQQPLDTIASEISEEYQIPMPLACEHVGAFISELERHCLVQRQESL